MVMSLFIGTGCQLLLPETETLPSPSSPTTSPTTPIDSSWTLPFVKTNAPVLPDIASVVALVKPSVVTIKTEIIGQDILGRTYKDEGAGSGWIIDEDGLIVTNSHVVEGAESITVTLDDGRTFPTETVRTDPFTDLAVIKIDAQNLPAANLGDSSRLRVGDWVVAIGNSLGLGISATHGIVSRKDVSISVESRKVLYDLIQTNAAINPGNSGGPLVNMQGEVIGITSAKLSAIGIEGMGYAISSNAALPIIKDLIWQGYVIRPYLGIVFRDVDQYLIVDYDLAVDEGAFIVEVVSDSPADKAGLEGNDVIVGLDDEEISTAQDLVQAIHSCQVGQEVEITFWRGGVKRTTYATLSKSVPSS